MQKRKRYSKEFKQKAVKRLQSRGDKSIYAIAKEMGINESSLRNWGKKLSAPREVLLLRNQDYEIKTLKDKIEEFKAEIESLEAALVEVEAENIVLKKAAILFAKESGAVSV